jgi:hypothetical protein
MVPVSETQTPGDIEMITTAEKAELDAAGRAAYAAGILKAPALSPLVYDLLAGLPVGTERAIEVMRAYGDGYEAARTEELAALGF